MFLSFDCLGIGFVYLSSIVIVVMIILDNCIVFYFWYLEK